MPTVIRTGGGGGDSDNEVTFRVHVGPSKPSYDTGIWLKTASNVDYKRIQFDSNPWTAGSWKLNSGVSNKEQVSTACELNGIIYCVNGKKSTTFNTLERLDLVNNNWLPTVTLPSSLRSIYSLVSVDDTIYFFSFVYDSDGSHTYIAVKYNPLTNTFISLASIPFNQTAVTSVLYNTSTIFLASDRAALCHTYNINTNSYTEKATPPNTEMSQGATKYSSDIYILPRNLLTYMNKYSISQDTWSTKSLSLPSEVRNFRSGTMTVIGDEIFIIGGWYNRYSSSGGSLYNKARAYKPSTNTFRDLPDIPFNMEVGWAILYNNLIYVHSTSTPATAVYSLVSKTYSPDPNVIIYEVSGDTSYRTSIINGPKLTWLPFYFRDVLLYQNGQLTKPELYYSTSGANYVKIRNAQ